MTKEYIHIKAHDGSMVRFKISDISLVQIPPSRLLQIKPNEPPAMAMIIIGSVPLQFQVHIAEQVEKELSELEPAQNMGQNLVDLSGQGPSRN